jgi:hypothetical protein
MFAMSLYRSRHAKRMLVQAVAALAVLGAHNANAQTWEYRSSLPDGRPSAPGYVTLDETSGKPVFRMVAGRLNTCLTGDLDATITRTETTTIITVVPRLRGCEETRFVIKNDGTGGRREVKGGSEWVWDGLERGLTLRK